MSDNTIHKWMNEARELNAEIELLRSDLNGAQLRWHIACEDIAKRDAEIERLRGWIADALDGLRFYDKDDPTLVRIQAALVLKENKENANP